MRRLLKNEKGFSLVELIIVIAIMAVIVGVVTPQYIRYVEQSRTAADEEMIDEFTNVLMTIATEKDFSLESGKSISICFDSSGNADFSDSELEDDPTFEKLVDTSKTYKLKSSQYKGVLKEIKLLNNSGTYSVTLRYY